MKKLITTSLLTIACVTSAFANNPIATAHQRDLCETYVMNHVKYPDELSMDWDNTMYDMSGMGDPSEAYNLQWAFTAKNGFGVKVRGTAVCIFSNDNSLNLAETHLNIN